MATTTSMHKPGWRSRRRSRLSLVERAVPKLGRMPEDGKKNGQNGEPRGPESKPALNAKIEVKPEFNGKSEAVLVKRQPSDDRKDVRETASPVPKPAPTDTITETSADDYQATPRSVTSTDHDTTPTAKSAAADLPSPTTQSRAAVAVETPLESTGLSVSTPETSSGPEPRQVGFSRTATSLPTSGPAMAALTARTEPSAEAEVNKGPSPDKQPISAGATLELDWNTLVDSGFTDPRDRSQPLPKNMHEIVRALIRQALSDQSSWRDRVILVTSPYQRTGKTTAAINFAFGLTTVASHHVVLVDVDTAGQGAVDRLGGGNDVNGITKALADESLALDEIVIRTDLERLTLVASGVGDDDNLDRFASRRMLQILRHLTEHPDTILIIDAPPILLSQEAAVLSVIAGQVVLAVDAGRTTADHIEHALQRIGERHNVSLVLNECSGIIKEDTPAPTGRPVPAATSRRSPNVKRRLPKAAAAGVFALCFLALPSAGQSDADGAAVMPSGAISAANVLPPERLSLDIKTNLSPCLQSCR